MTPVERNQQEPSQSVAVILVDYDNIKPNQRERTSSDATDNLIQIREWISAALSRVPISVDEAALRIYGGWTDERGTISARGNWLIASISKIRGRVNGVRYLPEIVWSIAAKPLRLKGLYRRNRADSEQKMVDTLIAVDALHFAEMTPLVVIVVTDDDDLVPALLAASIKRCNVCYLFRFRPKGDALNDGLLEAQGVRIIGLRE